MPVQVSFHDAWLKLGFKLNKIRVQSMIKETLQDSKFSVVLDSTGQDSELISSRFGSRFGIKFRVQSVFQYSL